MSKSNKPRRMFRECDDIEGLRPIDYDDKDMQLVQCIQGHWTTACDLDENRMCGQCIKEVKQ